MGERKEECVRNRDSVKLTKRVVILTGRIFSILSVLYYCALNLLMFCLKIEIGTAIDYFTVSSGVV